MTDSFDEIAAIAALIDDEWADPDGQLSPAGKARVKGEWAMDLHARGVRVAPSPTEMALRMEYSRGLLDGLSKLPVAPSPDAPGPLSVREDVRSAAWNYLALLDRHRVEFHQDKCPERGNFPLWYQHKASSADRVEAALQRLRDALATPAMVGVGDFEDDGETTNA